ncbi:hypothetical protein LPUS_11975 [Lasallia pustulata]|uniref:Uncharacterized protein n=1 Tax=Lasallia pustulata TaxID=136370 RepID=A0A1W5DD27_9LECA|nr:hypothetical protein LPUS_11975 [Lasallia pustulata]
MRGNLLLLVACAANTAFTTFAPPSSSNSTTIHVTRTKTVRVTATLTPPSSSKSLTFSSNATSSCVPSCRIKYPDTEEYQWAPASTSAVVVATIVLSVNNATNVTKTSTIYNTDYEDPMPGATNTAGTQVSTLTAYDPIARTSWSTVVAYPTPFISYAFSWEVEGTYETTSANGAKACVTAPNSTYSPVLLPSHPAVPFTCEANTIDPELNGEFYRLTTWGYPDGNWTCESPANKGDWFGWLFPNVIPTDCSATEVSPVFALTIVKSLTDTSTNYYSSSASAPLKLTPSKVESVAPVSVAAPATARSTVPSPPPPAEKDTPFPSSSSPSQQVLPSKAESSAAVSQGLPTIPTTPIAQVTLSTEVKPFTPAKITSVATFSSPNSPPTSSAPPIILSAGNTIVTAIPGSAVVNGGSTVIPGSAIVYGSNTLAPGSAITVSNTVISLATGASALIIGSSTIPLVIPIAATQSAALPAITFNSQSLTADSSSQFFLGSQTLKPGSAITISNTLISLATNVAAVVIGSSTVPLAAPVAGTSVALPVITFNAQLITANSASDYVFGSQTLVPGSAIAVSNTPVSLASNAAAIIIGSSTVHLSIPSPATSKPLPVLTLGSQTITANAASAYVIGTQTLTPGSAITLSNTIISLAPGASTLFIGTSTLPLTAPVLTLSKPFPVITINSQVITANAASAYVIGTQTLVPGSAITISNTVISLAFGASTLYIGTSTIPLAAAVPTGSGVLPVFTYSGSTLTANAASDYVFGTQTMAPGGPAITVAGAMLSLASDAGFIVEGTQTVALGAGGTSATGSAGASASDKSMAGQIIEPFTGAAAGKGETGGAFGGLGRGAWIVVGLVVGAWDVWGD